jgi:predicted nucleotidyltransferase
MKENRYSILQKDKEFWASSLWKGDIRLVKSETIDAIKFLEHCLIESGLEISKIILFGSQANGRATDESDVDVLIISNDFQGKDIFERAAMTREAEVMTLRRFMIAFDIITLTLEEFGNRNSLVSEYAKNGEVIYSI